MKTNQPQKNIDSDWNTLSFKDLGLSVIDGDRGVNYPKQDDFSNQGHCLFLNAGNVTRNGFNFSETSFITAQKDKEMGKGKLKKEDLIITTRGTIGNIAHYSNEINYSDIRINSGMAIIRNSGLNTKISTSFLLKYFNSSFFSKELKRVSFGSAQPQLTIQIINKFAVKIPLDESEQNRIVSVLETWDKSIEKLVQKIEVKKQIKKGLMQDLLTGKKRLKEFSDKWKSVKLGEIATFKKGKGLPKSDLQFDGKYEAIHYGELFTKYNEYIETVISRTNSNKGCFFQKRMTF
jgi:type I restriction enzyme S subunit